MNNDVISAITTSAQKVTPRSDARGRVQGMAPTSRAAAVVADAAAEQHRRRLSAAEAVNAGGAPPPAAPSTSPSQLPAPATTPMQVAVPSEDENKMTLALVDADDAQPQQQQRQQRPRHVPEPTAAERLVAGGAAGALSRTITAPIDRVKILFQVNATHQHKQFAASGAIHLGRRRGEGRVGMGRVAGRSRSRDQGGHAHHIASHSSEPRTHPPS